MSLYLGLSGVARNACVALCSDSRLLGVCEQERITRVRAAGFNDSGLPDEVVDEMLRRSNCSRADVTASVIAEAVSRPTGFVDIQLDHHFAHACAAFLPSPHDSATIVVCDRDAPEISVWDGEGKAITRVEWPWQGLGLARLYSESADAFGFKRGGNEQRLEAFARLDPTRRDETIDHLLHLEDDRLRLAPGWRAQIGDVSKRDGEDKRAALASALQARIGDLLLEFIGMVKRRAPQRNHLCVGGSLFHNSYFNSRIKLSGLFDEVFVPINPGNAGLAVGGASHVCGISRRSISPFLGPAYSPDEIKALLDNCKLSYDWAPQSDTVAIAVEALSKGRLVAWFDGPMEWGPRALGARSILANPFAPYALANLNQYLKQRDEWRGYAVSGLESAVREHLIGPQSSPYMECDYTPKDRARFGPILPRPTANIRVQTVGPDARPRFQSLLAAFGHAVGIPMLINTSFNGFAEPIVCSPRDAIRVFFGSGLDVLVLDQFVISK